MLPELSQLGFSPHDEALLFYCSVFGMLGSVTYSLLLYWDYFKSFPTGEAIPSSRLRRLKKRGWILSHMLIGALLGMVLALYFVDGLRQGVAVASRVLALAFMVGFMGPLLLKRRLASVGGIDEPLVDVKGNESDKDEEATPGP